MLPVSKHSPSLPQAPPLPGLTTCIEARSNLSQLFHLFTVLFPLHTAKSWAKPHIHLLIGLPSSMSCTASSFSLTEEFVV